MTKLKPFTLDHFRAYHEKLVFDDGERREPEDFQCEIVSDIFKGYREVWMVIPEGNGKSTLVAIIALYGADYSDAPWIPIGAASAKQARIVYDQADGFVTRTPGLETHFRCFGGYKLIRSLRNGGIGIEVFAHDPKTGDGVIPYPYAIVDELHRHDDLRLYTLWRGKLRKRNAQILTISTAGEPETPFENTRDDIRRRASKRKRTGSHLRAEGAGLVFHEWMVPSADLVKDVDAVKAANPLSTITAGTLSEDLDSLTFDQGDWNRLKCNLPTRSHQSAITDREWDEAQTDAEIPAQATIDIGLDVAWKWDTTVAQPLYIDGDDLLLGNPAVLEPPRDGSTLHPDQLKQALFDMSALYRPETCIMDTSRAEDIAHWIEDDLGITVVDRGQSNQYAVADFDAFMDALRNGRLHHTGDPDLRRHVLNAIARRLPGGDHRFDRPSQTRYTVHMQDRRVIDALTAAAMVVENANRKAPPARSVYEDRDLMTA